MWCHVVGAYSNTPGDRGDGDRCQIFAAWLVISGVFYTPLHHRPPIHAISSRRLGVGVFDTPLQRGIANWYARDNRGAVTSSITPYWRRKATMWGKA
ncbi:MAG: hypothetical protein ACI4AH_08025 [Muribaculaceae bacterium]